MGQVGERRCCKCFSFTGISFKQFTPIRHGYDSGDSLGLNRGLNEGVTLHWEFRARDNVQCILIDLSSHRQGQHPIFFLP